MTPFKSGCAERCFRDVEAFITRVLATGGAAPFLAITVCKGPSCLHAQAPLMSCSLALFRHRFYRQCFPLVQKVWSQDIEQTSPHCNSPSAKGRRARPESKHRPRKERMYWFAYHSRKRPHCNPAFSRRARQRARSSSSSDSRRHKGPQWGFRLGGREDPFITQHAHLALSMNCPRSIFFADLV